MKSLLPKKEPVLHCQTLGIVDVYLDLSVFAPYWNEAPGSAYIVSRNQIRDEFLHLKYAEMLAQTDASPSAKLGSKDRQ